MGSRQAINSITKATEVAGRVLIYMLMPFPQVRL